MGLKLSQETVLLSALILFVVVLIIFVNKTRPRFTGNAIIPNDIPNAGLAIYDKTGQVSLLNNNGTVTLYGTDDLCLFEIMLPTDTNNVPPSSIKFSLLNNNTRETIEYTYTGPNSPNISKYKFKVLNDKFMFTIPLAENTNYNLTIIYDASITNKYTIYTDYAVFYFGKTNTEAVSSADDASVNNLLGVSADNKNFEYGGDVTLPNPTGNKSEINYYIKKPQFDKFISNLSLEMGQNYNDIYSELKKYIPYKFDSILTVDRITDDLPAEIIVNPKINCDMNKQSCVFNIKNLRSKVTYNVKIRMIYSKIGDTATYKATPFIAWSFTTGNIDDTFYNTLTQIRDLMTTIRDNSINMLNFNKDQDSQNSRLNTLETLVNQKIRPALV